MARSIVFSAALLLGACGAIAPAPPSMCGLPRSFGGWQGASVRWQGILLDSTPHGMTLIAGECQRRGITIGSLPELPMVQRAIEDGRRGPGVIHVDVAGKISSERLLLVDRVHSITFDRMSEAEETAFWRSKGS